MQAARITQYGDASVVNIEEIDKPVAGAGQVLVKVHAASINPFDAKLRAGFMKDSVPLNFPATLGGDIAGEVVEVGPGVTAFAAGDKVYGQAAVVAGNSGAFAEFAATAASQLAKMPTSADYKQAASLPLVGVSAVQALTDHINLQPGQRLFIHGGAGGIGSIAVQIAKNIGAYVAVTATGEGVYFAKQLGADEVIDYKNQDFAAVLKNYDAAFDTVGADFDKTLQVLKPGGIAVSMIAKADEAKAKELGVEAITQDTKVTTEKLEQLAKLVDGGVIVPQVAKTFKLSEVRQAFEAYEKGGVLGKVVVEVG